MATIEEWLGAIGLEQYIDKFLEEGYDDMLVIPELTEQDLEEMGIKKGMIYL